MAPALKSMGSTDILQHLCSWPQVEVIGVIENKSNPKCLDLLCREAFDGGLGGNGHEGGKHCDTVCLLLINTGNQGDCVLTRQFHT